MKNLSGLLVSVALGSTFLISACGQVETQESDTLSNRKRYALHCSINVTRKADNKVWTYEATGKKTYRQPTIVDISDKERSEFQKVSAEAQRRCNADYLNINTVACSFDNTQDYLNWIQSNAVGVGVVTETPIRFVDLTLFRSSAICTMKEAR